MRANRLLDVSRAQAGFTLIEIMVVIVILGLLATLVASDVIQTHREAMAAKAATDVRTIHDAAKGFRIKNGRTPTMDDLTREDATGHSSLEMLAQDPWHSDYVIRDLDHGRFEVVSFGPDRIERTDDDIIAPPKTSG